MATTDKKVLMVSYYYPPLAGIGTLRSLKFAQYLPENEWNPIVLTPASGSHLFTCNAAEGDLPGVKVLRTGYFDVATRCKAMVGLKTGLSVSEQTQSFGSKLFKADITRRNLRLAKSLILFPDAKVGWYRSAVREGLAAIKKHRPSIIYSTSPPVTAHLIARRLKKLTGIPWVAELRDPWSKNLLTSEWPKWREQLESHTEKWTLSEADGIITVNSAFSRHLISNLGTMNGNQVVIPNGFDPSDFREEPPPRQEKFTLSHMGNLYGMVRDPAPLFTALKNLINQGEIDVSRLELNFYGFPIDAPYRQRLVQVASESGLEAATNIMEAVNYRDSLALQQRSTLLLVIEILTERGRGVVPAKIYEHLGARRPTLALVPGEGEVKRLLELTNGGSVFDPRRESQAIEQALCSWYREWLTTGTVAFAGNEEAIYNLTRQSGAGSLARFMEKIVLKGEQSRLEKECPVRTRECGVH